MKNKKTSRIIFIVALLMVFTTTNVFSTAGGFNPWNGSQPITGAGKGNYERYGIGYFSRWDSKSGSIIPAVATAEKPGIDEKYTDQAKRAPVHILQYSAAAPLGEFLTTVWLIKSQYIPSKADGTTS